MLAPESNASHVTAPATLGAHRSHTSPVDVHRQRFHLVLTSPHHDHNFDLMEVRMPARRTHEHALAPLAGHPKICYRHSIALS